MDENGYINDNIKAGGESLTTEEREEITKEMEEKFKGENNE